MRKSKILIPTKEATQDEINFILNLGFKTILDKNNNLKERTDSMHNSWYLLCKSKNIPSEFMLRFSDYMDFKAIFERKKNVNDYEIDDEALSLVIKNIYNNLKKYLDTDFKSKCEISRQKGLILNPWNNIYSKELENIIDGLSNDDNEYPKSMKELANSYINTHRYGALIYNHNFFKIKGLSNDNFLKLINILEQKENYIYEDKEFEAFSDDININLLWLNFISEQKLSEETIEQNSDKLYKLNLLTNALYIQNTSKKFNEKLINKYNLDPYFLI